VGPNDRSAAGIGLTATTSIADKVRSDKARAFKHKKAITRYLDMGCGTKPSDAPKTCLLVRCADDLTSCLIALARVGCKGMRLSCKKYMLLWMFPQKANILASIALHLSLFLREIGYTTVSVVSSMFGNLQNKLCAGSPVSL
jgi:hypothetical protein